MDFSLIFAAGAADVIQVIIFLLIMGGGAFFQAMSAAAEKKKQATAQNQKKPAPTLEEKLTRAATEVVRKPRPSKREKVVDAMIVAETSSRREPLVPPKTAIPPTPVASRGSEPIADGLAVEIHHLLHDPQSIRQAVVLAEVLTRKQY